MFQNLRANNQLFILHKDENPLVDIGSVVSVSAAKPKYPMPTPIGQIPQMEMVVDVVVCVNGQNTTFQNLPAGADIADFGQNGNIVISCSREAMNSEVSAIRQKSLDELNRRNYHENVISGCDKILTILNPEFAEKQRQEQEIASSHLARRTFIGNIYKKVKDPNIIGSMSGHVEGSKAFARYRDIDDEIKLDVLKEIE